MLDIYLHEPDCLNYCKLTYMEDYKNELNQKSCALGRADDAYSEREMYPLSSDKIIYACLLSVK